MSSSNTAFSCSVCQIHFESNLLQRAHTKTDWHVYNLKRRMVSLPSVTLDVYLDNVATSKQIARIHASSSRTTTTSDDISHSSLVASMDEMTLSSTQHVSGSFIPLRCLFCTKSSQDLDKNVSHMQTAHGLFIPNQKTLMDLETFVKYLFTIITEFNECLYCGKIKDSAESIRQHMLSTGHCSLNPDAGSEYEDFYDSDSEEGAHVTGKKPAKTLILDDELHLLSGKTIGHRSQSRARNLSRLSTAKSAPHKAIEDNSSLNRGSGVTDRQLAARNANMGLTGVSPLQRRALLVLEKKMLKRETRARNQYRDIVEKAGNKQKFFKPDVPGPKNG